MSAILIAQRYAQALSESVTDSQQLEVILNDLNEFRTIFLENNELHTALSNPAIPPHTREGVLDDVLTALALQPVARNLIKILFLRRRIALLSQVVSLFEKMVDERLNRVTAQVTTATPLTPETERRVREGLVAFSNKTVTLETTRDPEILGGVVAQIGNIIIDGSWRARLNQLKQALLVEEK